MGIPLLDPKEFIVGLRGALVTVAVVDAKANNNGAMASNFSHAMDCFMDTFSASFFCLWSAT
jgi:hypothetical protein